MAARRSKNSRQAVRTPTRTRNNGSGLPGWAGPLLGLLVGIIATIVVIHHAGGNGENNITMPSAAPTRADNNKPAIPTATSQATTTPAAAASRANDSKKPQFDFYSVLPEKDVRIPDAELKAQVRAEQQQNQVAATPAPSLNPSLPVAPGQKVVAAPATTVPPPSDGSSYLLQIGSFPNAKDAEAFKAKLALQGFNASIQPVLVNGQPYNRVRLGPFHSATQLEAIKKRLSDAGIRSIALKEGH